LLAPGLPPNCAPFFQFVSRTRAEGDWLCPSAAFEKEILMRLRILVAWHAFRVRQPIGFRGFVFPGRARPRLPWFFGRQRCGRSGYQPRSHESRREPAFKSVTASSINKFKCPGFRRMTPPAKSWLRLTVLLSLLACDWYGDPSFGQSLFSRPLSSQPAVRQCSCHVEGTSSLVPLGRPVRIADTSLGIDLPGAAGWSQAQNTFQSKTDRALLMSWQC
jgi:hypothetical protein